MDAGGLLPVRMTVGLFGTKHHERARFYDSLATAIDAGLPPDRALGLVTPGRARFGAAAARMKIDVAAGKSLSETMAGHPGLFEIFEVHAVEAGEHAGRLPDVLGRLGRYFAARGRALDEMGTRLVYPVVLLHGAVLLPPLFLLIRDGLAAYLSAVFPILLFFYGVVFGSMWLFRSLMSRPASRARAERFVLSFPWLGGTARSLTLADYAFALSILVSAGVPVVDALDKTAQGSRSMLFRDAGRRVAAAVRTGAPLGDSLAAEDDVFGRLFVEAVRVGEEAGRLDDTLERSARVAQEEADQALQRLAVALPAVTYAVAAGIVAFVVFRFWMSLYQGT